MTEVCMFRGGARLVPYEPSHDARTVDWLNDPSVREGFGLSRDVTLEGHRAFLAAQPALKLWAILDVTGRHAGNMLLHLEPRRGAAYLQMYIGPNEARGRGLGRDALACALGWAFELEGLHRVWLHVLPDNVAARRLYAAAGFQGEGVERQAVWRHGAWGDQLRLSLLAAEWAGRR